MGIESNTRIARIIYDLTLVSHVVRVDTLPVRWGHMAVASSTWVRGAQRGFGASAACLANGGEIGVHTGGRVFPVMSVTRCTRRGGAWVVTWTPLDKRGHWGSVSLWEMPKAVEWWMGWARNLLGVAIK